MRGGPLLLLYPLTGPERERKRSDRKGKEQDLFSQKKKSRDAKVLHDLVQLRLDRGQPVALANPPSRAAAAAGTDTVSAVAGSDTVSAVTGAVAAVATPGTRSGSGSARRCGRPAPRARTVRCLRGDRRGCLKKGGNIAGEEAQKRGQHTVIYSR